MKLSHQLALMVILTLLVTIIVQLVYYLTYTAITQDKARVYVDNIMNQVEETLNNTVRDIKEAASTISYDRYIQEYLMTNDPLRRMELYDSIKNSMNYMNSTNRSIYNMILLDMNDRVFSLYSTDYHSVLNDLGEKYGYIDEPFDKAAFSSAFKEKNNSEIFYYAYISPVFSTASDARPKTKIGVCILISKIDDIQNIIKRISFSENSHFIIEDHEGRMIASNKTDLIGNMIGDLDFNEVGFMEESNNLIWESRHYIVQKRHIDSIGFNLISILPVDEITSEIASLRNYGLLTGAAMAFLLMFISILFFNNITGPVSSIASFLKSIDGNYLHKRLHMPEANEIGQLAVNINKMLSDIEDITRKIVNTQSSLYEMELGKKQAELSALQSQINPHFLYNTLNCIQSMGLTCGSMEIVSVSAALVRIFRYSIKADDIVKIKDEVACVKDYLNVMSIRYNGKFIVAIDVDQEILDKNIIKMVLQPIVENAIYHGLEQKRGEGRLLIKGSLENFENIILEITDDGKGIDPDSLHNIQNKLKCIQDEDTIFNTGKSIGVFNIHKRICLQYGNHFGVEIDSRENEWTKVLIKLPVQS